MRAIVRLSVGLVGLLVLGSGTLVLAQLIPPAGPASPASAKFTLGDVFLRLTTGAAGARRAGAFTEPAPGPIGATMVTTDQLMAAAPAVDDTSGAAVGDVLGGKTYWGLRSGAWGQLTGTMATQVLSASSTAVVAGYYATTDLATVDSDLAAASIKSGVSIFGIDGSVIAATGDAVAGDVRSTKTFSNLTAAGIVGAMADNGAVTMTPTTADQPITAGYHNGTGKVVGDAGLLTGNIRAGVTVFGVAGDPNVVNTSTGTAAASDIVLGKMAWVAGSEIVGTGAGYVAGVPRTGQMVCYDASDVLTACPGSPVGQDGALQRGMAYANPRFAKNTDGTVTDNMTGLIWLGNANCFSSRTWSQAMGDAAGLATGACGLTDGSVAGAWRLPNAREQQSLVDYNYANPSVPDTLGTAQWTSGNPFTSIQASNYWTSTFPADGPGYGWFVNLYNGNVDGAYKTSTGFVWPVRGGPFTGTGTGPRYAAGVPRTWQRTCLNASNAVTACPGSPLGQDGALQKGLAYPNPRFTKNADGTVTDMLTGLTWLGNANCFGSRNWSGAIGAVAGLASGACGLTDGSVAGAWRLPNVKELLSLVDYNYANPTVPDTTGTAQWSPGNPFTGLTITSYWTSSTGVGFPTSAWYVYMYNGVVSMAGKSGGSYVWPVRDGP